jgi:deazaflavin-dependent oxidoreductase (nitroreductase family)
MADFNDWNAGIVKEFHENGGKVGGPFEGRDMILIHHVGAKSGTERVTPLVYRPEGDRMFIFASKGGAADNPDWYHNLVANPRIKAEIGTETLEFEAVVVGQPERDEVYARQAAQWVNFDEYQKKTERVIPVVELKRV